MRRWVSRWVFVSVVACGCAGGDDPTDAPSDTDGGSTPADPLAGLPSGPYLVGMSLAPVGGLVVPFQLTVTPAANDDGTAAFSTVELRAVGADDAVSDVLASVADVPVSVDGGFDLVVPSFTLPAAFSVTGSDVEVDAELVAATVGEASFCGDVSGALVTFGIDLAGSTFGAVRWDDRTDAIPTSCEGTVGTVPRIEDCPTLVGGTNTLSSGGVDRTLEVVVPSDYDAANAYPLVIVWHGFGGTAADMIDGTGLRPYADELGVILVAPQGEDIGGQSGFDAFSDPATNLDAVLFDDVVTCATQSFSVDPDRIHVTGMSNGGLMTGYLSAVRSDVIASVAPMSGGVGIDPVDTGYAMPALVIWGGEPDVAFDQDFNLLSTEMIDLYLANDQFVVGCDHGLGHTLLPSFWPWTLGFLLDHPRTLTTEPYAGGLPAGFPDYCAIR